MASKVNVDIYMASSSSQNRKWSKRKYQGGHQQEDIADPQGRKRQKAYQLGKGKKKWFFKKKKNLPRLKCYNCGKKGHFACDCKCDCKEPKKLNNLVVSAINVASSVLLTESYPLWTIDSGATDHVVKDKSAFVEFRRIP